MEITVSSGRKIYVRGAGGYYDSTQDAFTSQTITLPDDSTPAQIAAARINLQEELDKAVDLHLYVNGLIKKEEMITRNANRKSAYSAIRMLTGGS